MRLLWGLDAALDGASVRLRDRYGVTGPERLVLRIVGVRPDISAGELAEVLVAHPSTLSGTLRALDKKGLIARHSDPRDARRAQLRLTGRGARIDTLRSGTVEQAVQRIMNRQSEQDLATTRAVLEALIAELSD